MINHWNTDHHLREFAEPYEKSDRDYSPQEIEPVITMEHEKMGMNEEEFRVSGWVYVSEQVPPLNTLVKLGKMEMGVLHLFDTIISRPFKDECPLLDVLYYEKDGCQHQLTTDLMWKPPEDLSAIKELVEWVARKFRSICATRLISQ